MTGRCPNCNTPRGADDAFCEVCGLDYTTGELPQEPAPPAAASAPPAAAPSGWEVVIDVDPDWFAAQEAETGASVELPATGAPRHVALLGDLATIGRRSEREGWYPTIDLGHPVDDPACSRHHAELRRSADGWMIADTGSTNGTTVNGSELASGDARPLADGDVVHLGAFTRLTVRKVAS